MKTTQKIASITLASCLLFMQPAQATGIPVLDGLAEAHHKWQVVVEYAAKVQHYANVIANWDIHLKSLITDKIDQLLGVDKVKGLTEYEMEELFADKKVECAKSGSLKSIQYCKRTIELQKEVYKTRTETEKRIEQLESKIKEKQARANGLTGAGDKGKHDAVMKEIQALITEKTNAYADLDGKIKKLERDIGLLTEARQRLINDQLQGNAMATIAVEATIAQGVQNDANYWQEKANRLRNNKNNPESTNALMRNSRF